MSPSYKNPVSELLNLWDYRMKHGCLGAESKVLLRQCIREVYDATRITVTPGQSRNGPGLPVQPAQVADDGRVDDTARSVGTAGVQVVRTGPHAVR